MKRLLILFLLLWCFLDHGVSGVDEVSVMEGDSVTLHTGVQTNQQYRIRWYYKDTRIAQINRVQSKVCTDVQCNEGTERFRDRLKLDNQTGSLTITHTTTEDSGEYTVKIISSDFSSDSEMIFSVSVHGPGPPSGPPSGLLVADVAGIVVGVVLLLAAAVIYCLHRLKQKRNRAQWHDDAQRNLNTMNLWKCYEDS